MHLSAGEPASQLVPSSFSFVPTGAHYDGVYSLAIAHDPFARGEAHKLIDSSAYRYGHPGYGWLAWLASAGGQPGAIPYALVLVSLLGLGVASAAASFLARRLGMSPWWGLAVAANPGCVFAVTADTSETVAVACALLALLLWVDERWLWAGAAIAVGCFTKEPLVLVPAGLLAWEIVGGRRPSQAATRLGALAVGPALYAVWLCYCWWVFVRFPFTGSHRLAWPFIGWVDTFNRAGVQNQFVDPQVGLATSALLIAVGAALLIGVVRAARLETPVGPVLVAFAAFVYCANWLELLFPKDLIRLVALPLALLPFVFAGRFRIPA